MLNIQEKDSYQVIFLHKPSYSNWFKLSKLYCISWDRGPLLLWCKLQYNKIPLSSFNSWLNKTKENKKKNKRKRKKKKRKKIRNKKQEKRIRWSVERSPIDKAKVWFPLLLDLYSPADHPNSLVWLRTLKSASFRGSLLRLNKSEDQWFRLRAKCEAVQCSTVQCSAVQCSAVQYSAVQYSAVQYSALLERIMTTLLRRAVASKSIDRVDMAATYLRLKRLIHFI